MINQQISDDPELQELFARPIFDADVEHWAKMAYWDMHECIALSLGKEPRRLIWDQIERFERRSSFVREYRNRLEIVRRAVRMAKLSHENPPKHVFEWARGIGLAYPENLCIAVSAVIGEQQDWKKLYLATNKQLERTLLENQELIKTAEPQIDALTSSIAKLDSPDVKPRERDSMLKLILGIAIKGYGYDPKASRSERVTEIASDLTLLGIPLDADTVRRYLNEAKTAFPEVITE